MFNIVSRAARSEDTISFDDIQNIVNLLHELYDGNFGSTELGSECDS